MTIKKLKYIIEDKFNYNIFIIYSFLLMMKLIKLKKYFYAFNIFLYFILFIIINVPKIS